MILQNWWYTTLLGVKDPIQPPLKGDVKTDVLIVGGGVAGLASALRLMNTGKKVVLLERNICGGSSTGKSAGFLTPDSELELSQLLRRFGPEGARTLWESATKGVDNMVSVIQKYQIDCDLQKQDSLFIGSRKNGLQSVEEEAERAFQMMAGSNKNIDSDTINGFIEHMDLPNAKMSFMSALMGLRKTELTPAKLAKISIPTMVIWGSQDQVIPIRNAEPFVSSIRGCYYLEMKKCGHAPYVEEPLKFAKAVIRFLEQQSSHR